MRQTPEGSLAHVEDQGQSGLPSFSLLSSALARLSAPSLSLLSSLDHQNLVDIFPPVSFLAQLNFLFLLDQQPTLVSLFVGGEGQCHSLHLEVVTILSLSPYLSPVCSGPGLLLCREVPKRHARRGTFQLCGEQLAPCRQAAGCGGEGGLGNEQDLI